MFIVGQHYLRVHSKLGKIGVRIISVNEYNISGQIIWADLGFGYLFDCKHFSDSISDFILLSVPFSQGIFDETQKQEILIRSLNPISADTYKELIIKCRSVRV